jgi:hypothetical protein
MMRPRTSLKAALALLALASALAAAPASAQETRLDEVVENLVRRLQPNPTPTPQPGAVYQGCLNHATGAVRIVDALPDGQNTCGENEIGIELAGPGGECTCNNIDPTDQCVINADCASAGGGICQDGSCCRPPGTPFSSEVRCCSGEDFCTALGREVPCDDPVLCRFSIFCDHVCR